MATRKTGGKGTTTGGRKRHSPSTRKPATIDMEPNEVKSKTAASGKTDAPSVKTDAASGKTVASDKPGTVAPPTSGKAETSMGGGAAGAKSADVKPADAKPTDAKTTAATGKAADTKSAAAATGTAATAASATRAASQAKPSDAGSAETKPTETKPSETKPTEARSTEARGGSVPKVSSDKTAASDGKPASGPAPTAGGNAAGKDASTSTVASNKGAPEKGAVDKGTADKGATGAGGSKPATDDTKRPTPAALVPPAATAPKPGGGATATPPRESTPRDAKGAGFGALLAAGLVGGVVTLGGAWALGAFDDDAGVLRDETATLRSELDRRITAVESAEAPATLTRAQVDEAIAAALAEPRAAAPDEATTARLTQLENELATARASLAALEDAPPAADPSEALDQARAVIAALETRVGQLSERLDAAENSGGSGLSLERATALTGEAVNPVRERVAELAGRVETLSATVSERGRTLTEARTTLDDVQATLNDLRQGQDALGTRLEERIAAAATPLRERLDKVDATVSNLRTDLDAGLEAAQERTAGLRGDLDSGLDEVSKSVAELDGKVTSTADELRTALDTTTRDLGGRIETARTDLTTRADERAAATDERLEVIEADIADTGPEERAAAALALANLRTRLDAGEPYQVELELVRDTQAQADLEPLRAYATEGIMTLPQLRDGFDEAADAILAATRPQADGAVGGFTANLRNLVQVRRAGDGADGDSPRAIISDIRGALAKGDLEVANQAWQRLPTAGKNASSNWHGRLLARIQAGEILPAAVSRLIRDAG